MKCRSCGNNSEFNRDDHGISCVFCGSVIPGNSILTDGHTEEAVIHSEQESDSQSRLHDKEGEMKYGEFQKIVLEYVFPVLAHWSTEKDSVKITPNINHTKLNNFLSNFDLQWFKEIAEFHGQESAAGVQPSYLGIFAQVDCTVFGGAKESVVFCWGGIAHKALGEDPAIIEWDVCLESPAESVGIINPVLSIGEYEISFAGSGINNDMLSEFIGVLNSISIE